MECMGVVCLHCMGMLWEKKCYIPAFHFRAASFNLHQEHRWLPSVIQGILTHLNPLQYSWASLVAQLVKNPPAMQETGVRSLGWEDCLEKGKGMHSSVLAWRIPVAHDWVTFSFE